MSDYLEQRRNQKQFGKPPKEKKKYTIPKKSAKKIAEEKAQRELLGGDDTELLKWYKRVQKQLTGKCCRCGATYDYKKLSEAIGATAHILPKRGAMFPSVAMHPLNWIELGKWCGCHAWLDQYASWQEVLDDPKIGQTVAQRFLMVEPDIAADERHRIPEALQALIVDPFGGKYGGGG